MFDASDRLVVLDVEATCDDHGSVPRDEMEIIEIGAVLVEPIGYAILGEFQSFVRPVRHPRLTVFCRKLTSIAQADLDRAPRFPEAAASLQQWMTGHGATVFCSWGDYDRKQIEQDCRLHQILYPMPARHVNLKAQFAARRGLTKGLGMSRALREVGLDVRGTHHRGIDDARNIARLLRYAISPDPGP